MPRLPVPPRQILWRVAAALLVAASLLWGLEGYPLLDPDEGRNAEVAREMAETNDYVLPHLNGLPYLDKPALYFATGAAAMEVLGPRELAARLPSVLFTLATLVVVWWFARTLFDRRAAWIASLVTAATPFTVAYARTVIFDSALTLWVVLAIAAFHRAIEHADNDAGIGWRWRALAWGAMALGALTKGPVALVVPLLVAIPYAIWRGRARAVVDATAVLLFLAVVLPWVLAVSRTVPEFLRYVMVTETARRLATTELGRQGPIWYFLVILPAAALPWSVVAATALARRRRPDHTIVFLAIWILAPLVFFTLSQSKRPQYVLPLVPAIGLLVAAAWREASRRLPGLRAGAASLALLGVFFVLVRNTIPEWVPAGPGVAAVIPHTALALGLASLAGAALAWFGRRLAEAALVGLALPVLAIPTVSGRLMHEIGRDRSAAELAWAIDAAAPHGTEVVGVEAFPLSLPFYLGRTVTLATADVSELTSNYLVRHADRWRRVPESPLRDAAWWRQALDACTAPRVFVARADDDDTRRTLAARLPLIAATRRYAAYGPCGASAFAELASRD